MHKTISQRIYPESWAWPSFVLRFGDKEGFIDQICIHAGLASLDPICSSCS